jgi:hypothetical protein
LFYKLILLFFFHDNHRYLEKHDYHTNGRKFGVKPGFSFDWFDTGRPDEIAIRVIPDRKELSRRLKGAGKSYSPLRDSVHELLQERSEEMA